MKKLLTSLLVLLIMMPVACINDKEPENIGKAVGDPLPQFSVTLNDGTIVSTPLLKGKVAVIEFFNTGCDDCRRSFPTLEALYAWSLEHDDVTVFAIARDEDLSSVAGYWHDNDLTIPFSPQPDREVYSLFATVGIPRIYIADKEGIITSAFSPDDNPSLTTLIKAVEMALE